jgi:hypothetical protein
MAGGCSMEQRHRDFIACRPQHDRKAWLPVRAGATLAGARVETEFQDPRISHSDALDRMSLRNSPVAEHDSVEGQRHKGVVPPSSLYLSHATVSMEFLGRGPSGRFSCFAFSFFYLKCSLPSWLLCLKPHLLFAMTIGVTIGTTIFIASFHSSIVH